MSMADMTRAEHMAWCKSRAREYAEAGDRAGCIASFASDVTKHPETRDLSTAVAMTGISVRDDKRCLLEWVDGWGE